MFCFYVIFLQCSLTTHFLSEDFLLWNRHPAGLPWMDVKHPPPHSSSIWKGKDRCTACTLNIFRENDSAVHTKVRAREFDLSSNGSAKHVPLTCSWIKIKLDWVKEVAVVMCITLYWPLSLSLAFKFPVTFASGWTRYEAEPARRAAGVFWTFSTSCDIATKKSLICFAETSCDRHSRGIVPNCGMEGKWFIVCDYKSEKCGCVCICTRVCDLWLQNGS